MFSNNLLMAAAGGSGAAYEVENSIRLNDDDSAYIHRTPGSAGDRQTWTISMWVKRGELGATNYVWHSTGGYDFGVFNSDDTLRFNFYTSNNMYMTTNRVFRDPSAWYHLVFTADSTSATTTITGAATDRLRLWVNGVQESSFSTTVVPAQNSESTRWNNTYLNSFGSSAAGYFDGYLAEIHFVDGTALAASDFGEFDTYGEWVPIEPSGLTYGTNGFYLNFAVAPGTDDGAGTDVSGNDNHFTDSGLTAADQVSDSPTDNYPTWTPLWKNSSVTLSDGNLKCAMSSWDMRTYGTWAFPTSGKYYFEIMPTSLTYGNWTFGASDPDNGMAVFSAANAREWLVGNDGVAGLTARNNVSGTASSDSRAGTYIAVDEVMMVAYDADNDAVWVGAEGSWLDYNGADSSATVLAEILSGDTSSAATTGGMIGEANMVMAMGNRSAGAETVQLNCGQLGFAHTPPTGFSALSTANLTTLSFDPADHHQVELVSHDGTSTNVTCNWDMDVYDTLIITKNRDSVEAWYVSNAIDGYDKYDSWDNTGIGVTTDANVHAVSGATLTLGSTLGSDAYIVEFHKAGLAASRDTTNSDGSITGAGDSLIISANTTSGFSMLTFTGGGIADTVGHGLTQAPEFIITHSDNGGDQHAVYHVGVASDAETDYLALDTTAAAVDTDMWNDTAPTASVYSIGTSTYASRSGATFTTFLWHGVEGYSVFGSYEGNSSTNGTVTNLGLKANSFIYKNADGVGNWVIIREDTHPYNVRDDYLTLEETAASGTATTGDLGSNFWKGRTTHSYTNGSGNTYIYAAFGTPTLNKSETPAKAR